MKDITRKFGEYNTDKDGEPFKYQVTFRDGTTEIVWANNPPHAMMLARIKRQNLHPGIWHEATEAKRIKFV